ncbi:MAG TPA: hypothetical protein VF589_03060 [Allosphingosinicella sp.]
MSAIPLLLLAAAQPAAPPPGAQLPPKAVSCIIKAGGRRVVDLLVTEPATPAEAAAFQRLGTALKRCGALSAAGYAAEGTAIRAALSRTLVTRVAQRVVTGPNSNPNFSPNLFTVQRGYDHAGVMQGPYRLAKCMTSVNLMGVAKVVATAPGTPAEREAMQAVAPTLASCVDRNQQVALSTRTLRMAIDIVYAQRTFGLLRTMPLPGRRVVPPPPVGSEK